MTADLSDARSKLVWAKTHYELLGETTRDWFEQPSKPTVIAKPDLANQRYAVIYEEPRPKPLEWSLMAGDFLNNLRSVLDYCIRQIVISQNGTPGNQQFPLTKSVEGWERIIKAAIKGQGPLVGIDIGSREGQVIYNAQPHKGGNEPLVLLGCLNNADKHRKLNVSTLSISSDQAFKLSVSETHRLLGGYLVPPGTVIEPGDEIGWLAIDLMGKPQATLNLSLPTEIAFDGVPMRMLRRMFEQVRDVVVALEAIIE